VILTAYEFNYDNENFITILKEFNISAIAPILGNKFVMYNKEKLASTLVRSN